LNAPVVLLSKHYIIHKKSVTADTEYKVNKSAIFYGPSI